MIINVILVLDRLCSNEPVSVTGKWVAYSLHSYFINFGFKKKFFVS